MGGFVLTTNIILLAAFFLALGSYYFSKIMTPIVIRNALKWGIIDTPNARKVHAHPTPRFGGLAIAPPLLLGLMITSASCAIFSDSTNKLCLTFFGFFWGASIAFLVGAIDDRKTIRARYKLIGLFIGAVVTAFYLPLPDSLFGISVPPLAMRLAFIVWLAIIPHCVNLLDGIDGLTATLGIIYALIISAFSLVDGHPGWLLITIPFACSLYAFLKFNWNPARIFLGDSGSYLIGFFVAFTSLYFSMVNGSSDFNPFIALCLTSIWAFDTGWAIVRRYFDRFPSPRLLKRRSLSTYFGLIKNALYNIANADDNHLHHRLLRTGYAVPQAVGIMACSASLFFLFGLTFRFIEDASALPSWGLRISVPFICIAFFSCIFVLLKNLLQARTLKSQSSRPLALRRRHIQSNVYRSQYSTETLQRESHIEH